MGRSEREEEKEEMKRTLIALLALCLWLPLAAAEKKPLIADAIVGGAIRFSLKEPKGELTKADLEKVTELFLFNKKITDAGLKEVAKFKQLRFVNLEDTKVTKAGVDQLIKVLPKCRITHNATR